MQHIYRKLLEQYERDKSRLESSEDPNDVSRIRVDDVLRAHYLLCDYFIREGEEIALAGARDDNLLMSALFRQRSGFAGVDKWNTPYEQIATLFYGLVKNHPFHDGNKRTAFLVVLLHMLRYSLSPTFRQKALEDITVWTAGNDLLEKTRYPSSRASVDDDVRCIASWLKSNSRKTDKRVYQITYRDLDSILRRHGHGLEKPDRNYIDVVRSVNRKRRRGLKYVEIEESVKVFEIAFPGWTRVVPTNTVKEVRDHTGLTSRQGFDSAVFYKGMDSLPALIAQYHGPLLRLKDK